MNEQEFFMSMAQLRDDIASDDKRRHFDSQFLSIRKTPLVLYGFSYFLGWLGVDRFLLGQWGRGLGKLILCLGAIIVAGLVADAYYYGDGSPADALILPGLLWVIADWFLIGKATRKYSYARAVEIRGALS